MLFILINLKISPVQKLQLDSGSVLDYQNYGNLNILKKHFYALWFD